ncbi:MAG: SCP2 sterol-binding domain-containing protein [Anaerolineae bacterium]|nr:SCP2 sterol-binding domain-containing protein [Anaerolineae bacterium]
MSTAQQVRRIFDKLPETFIPEKANGVRSSIQFNLSGDGGGNWLVTIADNRVLVEERQVEDADLTFAMDARDYVGIMTGKSSPMILFTMGRIRTEGDLALAWKFRELFDPDRAQS